jgi:nicotinamide riboside kinase
MWSEVLFGRCPPWIREAADSRRYDLTLLLDVDCPWIDDPQRYLPHARREFLERCVRELEARNRPYVIIGGTWDERFARSVAAVDALLVRRRSVAG